MATYTIHIDRSKRLSEEPRMGHNRWHPDIPPAVRVDPGDTVVLETRDALDGAIIHYASDDARRSAPR